MISTSSSLSPPIFNDQKYQVRKVKTKTYLKGLGLWKYVEEDSIPEPLRENLTLQQIKSHEEEIAKGPKAPSFKNYFSKVRLVYAKGKGSIVVQTTSDEDYHVKGQVDTS